MVAAPKGKRQRTDQARKFRWTINDYNWEADPIGDKLLSLPLDKKIRCVLSRSAKAMLLLTKAL